MDNDNLTVIMNDLPLEVANLRLPSPTLRDWYRDEEARIIWLDSEINDDALDVSRRIFYYNKQDKDIDIKDRKPIKIFLNTPGGSVAVMWQIVQVIKMSKTPVWTINWCDSLSAGAHILAAGHKRFALPGTTILLHSGSCAYSGTVEQAENSKKYYDAMSKFANNELLSSTAIDQKVFKKKAVTDWYISAEEALDLHIIDKIIESLDELI